MALGLVGDHHRARCLQINEACRGYGVVIVDDRLEALTPGPRAHDRVEYLPSSSVSELTHEQELRIDVVLQLDALPKPVLRNAQKRRESPQLAVSVVVAELALEYTACKVESDRLLALRS